MSLGADFALPTNQDAKEALLEAIAQTLKDTVEASLGASQSAGKVTIISVNGVPISQRRLLYRLLQNSGKVDWNVEVNQNTTVITATNSDGNVVDTPTSGFDNGDAVSETPSANEMGITILTQVSKALEAATTPSDGAGGSPPPLMASLETTLEEVKAGLGDEAKAELELATAEVAVEVAVTDLQQEVQVSQKTTATETTTETVSTPAVTKVKVEGEITISNVTIGQASMDEFALAMKTAIKTKGCPGEGVQSCVATVLSVNGQSLTSRLRKRSRSLQDNGSLILAFEIALDAICTTLGCSGAETIGRTIQAQVTDDILAAIDDGSFLETVRLASTASLRVLLSSAVAKGNFEEIAAALSDWYPDWRGSSNSCFNDGGAPLYMKLFGTYFENTLEACCKRYFDWDSFTCLGDAGTIPSGFYPNWGRSEPSCLNSTETPENFPNYMRSKPEQWLENDIESCCERHYNWAYSECIALTGGNSSVAATGKWYVNDESSICQKDCVIGDDGRCGGLAQKWDTLYETAASCCSNRLHWIVSTTCEGKSNLQTVNGTSEWYVDWSLEKCVKDCEDSSDSKCGGFAETWDELYGSSSSECCDRLWYIERDECTL